VSLSIRDHLGAYQVLSDENIIPDFRTRKYLFVPLPSLPQLPYETRPRLPLGAALRPGIGAILASRHQPRVGSFKQLGRQFPYVQGSASLLHDSCDAMGRQI
jgi:hypothetical protein